MKTDEEDPLAPEDDITINVDESGVGVPLPEGKQDDQPIRRMKLSRELFERIGYTNRCPGCRVIRLRLSRPAPHSYDCLLYTSDAADE